MKFHQSLVPQAVLSNRARSLHTRQVDQLELHSAVLLHLAELLHSVVLLSNRSHSLQDQELELALV